MPLRRFIPVLLTLLLAGCSAVSAATPAAKPHRVAVKSLQELVVRPVPFRNLYELADAFRLRPPRKIAHVVRTTSPNYPVGHQDSFYVLSEDNLGYFVMHATIRAESPHLYLYVQNGAKVSQSALNKAVSKFEHKTYPTDRNLYGSEWRPGVDGDPHITCLYGDLRSAGAAGFFSAEDEYPREVNPYSNVREMFYINTNTPPGTSDFDVTLAHEFQHMIHFHVHPRDNAWLNEGMSVLAQRINGYPDSTLGYAQAFLDDPSTQLDTFGAGDNTAHYGGGYLFLAYIYNRFGRSVIHALENDRDYTDLELVNDVLRKQHIAETADQVFADWVVANYADDSSAAGSKYGYSFLPNTVDTSTSVSLPLATSGSLRPYATQYFQVSGDIQQKPFEVHFSASPTVPLVGVPGNSSFWWGNRGDQIDTTLTRTVDLRKVHQAHLHFKAWYDIENEYDYGYVDVSADGGKTWSTVRGTDTSSANPTGANYGNGYTGSSQTWRNETVNLSSYAGHRIELRFEYVTDDEVNLQGFALRDITIPEIGLHAGFSGWTSNGFVPVKHNAIPESWAVQLIENTAHGLVVQRVPVNAAGTGSLLVDPTKNQIKKLAIAVSPMASKTTVQSTFQLSVQNP